MTTPADARRDRRERLAAGQAGGQQGGPDARRATASGRRRRLAAAARASSTPAPDGHVAQRTEASMRPATRDERQQAEEDEAASRSISPTAPAIAGPMTPGRIQAVDSVANIRGRSALGQAPADRDVGDRRDRPGARGPGRSARRRGPASIGARPPTSSPIANRPSPAANGTASPPPVDQPAGDHDPEQRAEEERREHPAVQLDRRRARRPRSA